MNQEFYNHPKVKEARRLLIEAEREIIKNKKDITNNEICECSHKRLYHGHAHSINYTGGACEKCPCINFLQKRSANGEY